MDAFELEIKKEFIAEALLNLEEAEGSFMELESCPDPKPLLDKIFRLAHNLKGGSRAVGFGDVAEFTHQLENLVLKIKNGSLGLSPQLITTLLRSNDRLAEMLQALKGDLEARFDNRDLLGELEAWLSGNAPLPAALSVEPVASSAPLASADAPPPATAFFDAEEPAAPGPAPISAPTPMPMPPAAPVQLAASPPAPAAATEVRTTSAKDEEVVRVSLSRIELLNDYVGELIVLQSVIQQQFDQDSAREKLVHALQSMGKLAKDIQSLSMGLRMLPVKPLLQKLQRVIRDTAQALGKDVQLDIQGEGMDVDKSVLDQLGDPLIHIVRNAVDHGLEDRQGRVAAGKAPVGRIGLALFQEGNHLVIEVRDDGKGMDPDVLRRKGIEKGLVRPDEALSERQLLKLIFHPGFSTKEQTSEISGRGVGMDVVRTNVEKIGGQIDIQSRLGAGSVFRLQIPLSLAVIDGLVVHADGARYVLPLSQVQETLNLAAQKALGDYSGTGVCFELRGQVVPVFSINEALGLKKNSAPRGTGLIIKVQERLVALSVDEIVRSQQIVIKPLGNGLPTRQGWIGTCVLGDGQPTLIVSPSELLEGRVHANSSPRSRSEAA